MAACNFASLVIGLLHYNRRDGKEKDYLSKSKTLEILQHICFYDVNKNTY